MNKYEIMQEVIIDTLILNNSKHKNLFVKELKLLDELVEQATNGIYIPRDKATELSSYICKLHSIANKGSTISQCSKNNELYNKILELIDWSK